MKSVDKLKSKKTAEYNSANINPNSTMYIYTLKGVLVGTSTISKYAKKTGKTPSNIITILTSFKGYGFCNNNFISLNKIEALVTSEEAMQLFGKWLRKGYDRTKAKLKNIYKKEFNEEFYQMAMLYVSEAIVSERSVNNFEQSLVYKYRMFILDKSRKDALDYEKGLRSDFQVSTGQANDDALVKTTIYSDSDFALYINSLAIEGDSLTDTKKNYDCVEDYNSIKRFDVIGYILKESFTNLEVDIFIEILQGDFDFTSLSEIPNFKYLTLIRKYKEEVILLKKYYCPERKISNSDFLKEVIEKCWTKFIENKDRIISECRYNTFKTLDEYSLAEIIQ